MKIVMTSDMHGYLPLEVPPCDLFLIGGDVCPIINHSTEYQANWLLDSFLPWIEGVEARKKLFVAGNHDLIFERNFGLISPKLHRYYLQDSFSVFEGLCIYGTPWQLPYGDQFAFNMKEADLKRRYSNIPTETDIIISHGPPYGYGDLAITRSEDEEKWPEPQHVGSESLLARMAELPSLKLVVTGHIHENYGKYQIGDILVVNASRVNVAIKPINQFQLLDL